MSALTALNVDLNSFLGKVLVCKAPTHTWMNNQSHSFKAGQVVLVGSVDKSTKDITILIPTGGMTRINTNYGFHDTWAAISPNNLLNGNVFVFTGKLENQRDYYAQLVGLFGGHFSESVTRSTNYLVMADKNSTSSKAVKARSLGVGILDEAGFLKMISDGF